MSGLEFEILPSESSQPESELKTELTPRAYSLTRLADVKPERPLWLRLGHIPIGLRYRSSRHHGNSMAGWKASLPPYATDLHYQQLNATQLNELIGKGGLWASQAHREMARRERE